MLTINTLEGACKLIQGGPDIYQSIVEGLTAIYQAIDARLKGITKRIEIPWQTMQDTFDDLTDLRSRFEDLDEPPHRVLGMMREVLRQLATFLARPDLFMKSMDSLLEELSKHSDHPYNPSQQYGASIPQSTRRVLHPYTVMAGDTLHGIASRYRVAWREIVTANRLAYPYIDGDSASTGGPAKPTSPWTAKRGDIIQLPMQAPKKQLNQMAPTSNLASWAGDQDDADKRLFGADLYWDRDNLALTVDSGTGDIRTVFGQDNLVQSILVTFNVPFGSLKMFPSLGSWLLLEKGKWAGPVSTRILAHAVQKDLLGNPKIGRVTEVNVINSGGSSQVAFKGEAIDGSSIGPITI